MSVLEPLANRPLGERIRKDRRSDLEYLGIRAPIVRQAANRGFSFYSLSGTEILEIWDELWRGSRYAEVMALALEYYRPIVRRKATTPDIWPVLSEWHWRVENWAHADGLANLYSYLLERQHDDVYPRLQGWNAAVDLWPRRLSLVSLIHYTGKNAVFLPPGDVLPLVTTCMADDRHYIQLAVGWVLREMMRAYPGEILAYSESGSSSSGPRTPTGQGIGAGMVVVDGAVASVVGATVVVVVRAEVVAVVVAAVDVVLAVVAAVSAVEPPPHAAITSAHTTTSRIAMEFSPSRVVTP